MSELTLFGVDVIPKSVSLERDVIEDGIDEGGYITYRPGQKWIVFRSVNGIRHKRKIDRTPKAFLEWEEKQA